MTSSGGEGLTVGVIGSGIAGAFAAHFARQALGDRADLVVWERDSHVGGRVRALQVAGERGEAGASLIHSSNRYLSAAVDELQLHRSTSGEPEDGSMRTYGCWNGTSFDFISPSSAGEEGAFLMHRYGESLLKVQELVKSALDRLVRIYDAQARGEAFETPRELHMRLGLYDMAQQDGYSFFREHGVSDQFVLEMSDGIARGNYSQAGQMNAWATMVSLIGGGFGGGSLFSIVEGNVRLPEGLLSRSGARVFTGTAVNRVAARATADGSPGYTVTTAGGERCECDAVVIAAPLEMAGVEFEGVALAPESGVRRPYQTVHVTFVAGRANPAYFGLQPGQPVPGLILTRERPEIPFVAMGARRAADGQETIYKLFSREALDDALLDAMFTRRAETVRLVWQAYPVLNPAPVWPPFRLAPGLYYVNAMESAVSTMETEAIAARNVVNLLLREMR